MGHPWQHAISSAKKFGGKPEDYLHLHDWFDGSKEFFPDFRHRALRHQSLGIYEAEALFGPYVKTSSGREVPVRVIGEQHCIEDLGFVPTVADWLRRLALRPWMTRGWEKETTEEHAFSLARETAKRFGGRPEDYLEVHRWFDRTKAHFHAPQHRALRHHAQGVLEAEARFGPALKNADGEEVPVGKVAELHLVLELGRIPTVTDWLAGIKPADWMLKGVDKRVVSLSLLDLVKEEA